MVKSYKGVSCLSRPYRSGDV